MNEVQNKSELLTSDVCKALALAWDTLQNTARNHEIKRGIDSYCLQMGIDRERFDSLSERNKIWR